MELKNTLNLGTVDPTQALIYKWEIRDAVGNLIGLYIGKAKGGAKRPTTHYRRNVNRLLAGKPYRAGNPEGYRKSHRALAEAVKLGHTVELSFVCNVLPGENIDEVEQRCITNYNSCGGAAWQLNQ